MNRIDSPLEAILVNQLMYRGLWPMARNHKFAESLGRLWEFDFANVEARIYLDAQGGIWRPGGGGHTTAQGYADDCEKYAVAAALGWVGVCATGMQIESGWAVDMYLTLLHAPRCEACEQPIRREFDAERVRGWRRGPQARKRRSSLRLLDAGYEKHGDGA